MNILIKSTLVFCLCYSAMIFAQFNTINRAVEKKTMETKKINEEKEDTEKKIKKLNPNSKAALRKELDSLKNSIIKNSVSEKKEYNQNIKKLNDSILRLLMMKNINQNKSFERRKQMEMIEDENNYKFSKIYMPLNRQISITSPYGARIHPIFGNYKFHNGVDLAANYENVHSVLDGIVTEAGWDSNGGGNYIKVLHSNRFETAYLHLSEIYYKVGERVKAGFIIAKSGNTGNSTGPHLHFSVKEFGKNINPTQFLNDIIKVNNLIAIHYEH